ncbi:MAG: hypothetical protein FIB02_04915 [Desulfuromonas sp.]|nr:hypothetical protein [Desulfuromonas sp.]
MSTPWEKGSSTRSRRCSADALRSGGAFAPAARRRGRGANPAARRAPRRGRRQSGTHPCPARPG